MFIEPPSFEWARNLAKMLSSGIEIHLCTSQDRRCSRHEHSAGTHAEKNAAIDGAGKASRGSKGVGIRAACNAGCSGTRSKGADAAGTGHRRSRGAKAG